MRQAIRTTVFLVLAVHASAASALVYAQSAGGRAGPGGKTAALHACSLLTTADVEKVTGQREFGEPDATALYGGAGTACTFVNAQVILFSGEAAEANWTMLVRNYGHENAPRHPISGVGDRAYAFFPVPRDENEDTNAFVVVTVGPHVLAVSAVAEDGKPAESAQPHALALAKIALARLK